MKHVTGKIVELGFHKQRFPVGPGTCLAAGYLSGIESEPQLQLFWCSYFG